MAIYARLENGTYAEVTGVYKTDGTEVTEIFQGDRLVYSASNEIYGSLPLYYNGKGYDLTDYRISGNTVQDGTPSVDAPVDATGSGVRTGNLAKFWRTAYVRATDGALIEQKRNGMAYPIKLLTGQTITFSDRSENYSRGFAVFQEFDGTSLSGLILRELTTYTYTATENCYIVVWCNYDNTTIITNANFGLCKPMLNLGSTALPYEPYGVKLPLTVNTTEYPIYLGQVETTRRVKKLVLTGMENWNEGTSNYYFFINVSGRGEGIPNSTALSTHTESGVVVNNNGAALFFKKSVFVHSSLADFKSYLAAQYAAGTPVTVWYVLATEETGVVNEPLMKIGDYADTVSAAQTGVTIPTVSGANVLDMTSPVKPSEMYIKGKGIKPTGYGQLTDVNGVNILDKDSRPIYVHGQ